MMQICGAGLTVGRALLPPRVWDFILVVAAGKGEKLLLLVVKALGFHV